MVISWLLVCLFGVYVIQGSHSNCISNSLCFPCLTANFPGINSLKGIFWVAIFPVFPWSSQPLRFYIIFEKKINSFNSNFWGFITVKSSFKGDKRKRSKTTKANLFSQCECTQAIFFFFSFPVFYRSSSALIPLRSCSDSWATFCRGASKCLIFVSGSGGIRTHVLIIIMRTLYH